MIRKFYLLFYCFIVHFSCSNTDDNAINNSINKNINQSFNRGDILIIKENVDYCKFCYYNNIDVAISYPDSVVRLSLPNVNNSFLDTLMSFKNLKYLYLSGGKSFDIKIALKKINNLKNLNEIIFGNCDLSNIPKEISQIDFIQVLTIDDTIYKINNEFSKLKKLRELTITMGNPSVKIPKLDSLEYLNIYVIGSNSLPAYVSVFKNLKYLQIGYNVKILPNHVFQLKNLKELNITNSELYDDEVQHLLKYGRYNQLETVKKELPNCKIINNDLVIN